MISVLNRLRQLNGNKYIIFILWMVLCSCNLIKSKPVITVSTEPKTETENTKTTETKPESPKTHVPAVKATHEVVFQGQSFMVPAKKTKFKIALILPFHLGYKTKSQKRIASIMMDYYKGMKMALAELEASGLDATVYIYDNKNDSNELKRILRKKELYKMDLVIGPIQEKQVKIVSRVLKPYKIPVFSPFSSIEGLSDVNPLCYSFVSGNHLKAKQLVKFLEKHHKGKKLVIVRDGKNYDKSIVPFLIQELDKSGKIPYVKEAYSSSIAWTKLFEKKQEGLVFIASKQQNTVQNTLGGLIASKREVTVFGDNSWINFNDNDYMFWEALNMHILSNEFENSGDTMVLDFRLSFRESFDQDPSKFAMRGYDQISFIGDVLMAFGEHFPTFVNDNAFYYHSTYFNFVSFRGLRQNQNLNLLHYTDHKLQLVE